MGFENRTLTADTMEDEANRFVPEAGIGDILSASFESSRLDTTLFSNVRRQTMRELHETGPLLQPEDIKKKYGLTTDRELSEQEAIFIKDLHQEEFTRQSTIKSASKSILKGTILPFMGGMAGALTDPLDFAIGAMTGGIAVGAGRALGAKALGQFGIAAVENAVANAITEASVVKASQAELKEYTAQQAFQNVIVGSLAITGVVHGLKLGLNGLSKMGQSHVDATHNMADMASQNGLDVSKVVDLMESKAQEKLTLDPGIVKAAEDALGERSGAILDSVDNAKDLVRVLNEKAVSGEIDPRDVSNFKMLAEENGSPKERWVILDEDSKVQFSDKEIKEFQEAISSPEFKLEHNPDSLREHVEFAGAEIDPEIETKFREIPDLEKDSIKDYVAEIELNDENVVVLQRYLNCLGA